MSLVSILEKNDNDIKKFDCIRLYPGTMIDSKHRICDMTPSQYDAPIVTSILYREQRHSGAIHHDYRGYRHRERCGGCSWTIDNIDAIIDWGSPIPRGCPFPVFLGILCRYICVDISFRQLLLVKYWYFEVQFFCHLNGNCITFDAICMLKIYNLTYI